MQSEHEQVVLLDLKYCERCGGLWLRERGCTEVLCRTCSQESDDLLLDQFRTGYTSLLLRASIPDREQDQRWLVCGKGGHA